MSVDLVVVSMPVVETFSPMPTPGIYYIKSAVEQVGFSSIAKDLNVWFQKQDLNLQPIIDYFMLQDVSKIDRTSTVHQQVEQVFEQYVALHSNVFDNCKYVGIGLFSVYNIFPGIIFAEIIKEKCPNVKVIVGGNGTEDTAPGNTDIGEYFLKQNLANYVVYGEGEEAVQYILQGKSHPSVNSSKQRSSIVDLNQVAHPDYNDFFIDFPEYKGENVTIPIIGSRGCVRRCTFCNVAAIWPTYRFRSGTNIAQEMIANKEKYGVTSYRFTDSLINGSMKAFRDLCCTLEEYNKTTSQTLTWSGQFICRSRVQMLPEDFKSMKNAGCNTVSIGIESGSERVRNDIVKGFTEEDMIYTLDQCAENNIRIQLMFLVGYPTETDSDFQQNIDLLNKYSYYKHNIEVTIGKTLRLLDNTPLTDQLSHLYYFDDNTESEWVSTVVPDLTFEKRVERAKKLRSVAENIGYELVNIHDDENFFKHKLEKRLG
jgi:hypothetical protein